MNAYRRALVAYLEPDDRTQQGLADLTKLKQATISRYVTGERFPDAKAARAIHDATNGDVSFAVWAEVATERLLGEAA